MNIIPYMFLIWAFGFHYKNYIFYVVSSQSKDG